jgi:hypothetical protein
MFSVLDKQDAATHKRQQQILAQNPAHLYCISRAYLTSFCRFDALIYLI